MYVDQSNIARDSQDGKIAAVTGACQGIGRETARILAHLGARVAIAELGDTGGLMSPIVSPQMAAWQSLLGLMSPTRRRWTI
jgi:hypothetical protein